MRRVRQIILRRPRGERDAGMLRYAQHDRPPQSPGVPMYMVRDPLLMREKEGQLRHAKPQKGQARPGEFSLFVLRTFAALRLCVRLLCPQNILSQLLGGKGDREAVTHDAGSSVKMQPSDPNLVGLRSKTSSGREEKGS